MRLFNDAILEEIKKNVSIEDVVMSETGKGLYKDNFVSVCPFCGSKNTSFAKNDKFWCFSCGFGGNVFAFISKLKNISFEDAVVYVADKYLNKKITYQKPQQQPNSKSEILKRVYSKAAKFYYDQLYSDKDTAGMKYIQGRKISKNMAISFGLGYAGRFGDNLHKHLLEYFEEKHIFEAGLITKGTRRNADEIYDKFWNRVIFPIFNANGEVIAFGGRVLGDDKPKYLNSPETPIFSKGKNLYGYHLAKNTKKSYYICCEGNVDVIALHQHGFDNSVASLGTALTREQIELLRTRDEIVLAYDSDDAGVKAAKRAIELCREVGLKIRVINMTGAKDPDEFLKKFGKEKFQELVDNAETDRHFLIRTSKVDGKFNYDEAVYDLI